ncbi:hypothetical protein [Nocardioides sp. InS609-2]|uniref:hypothetical protein n=1 Tax=Nocardioides sp. InS609-2 TaxID=2760705 RepID=UPI0020BF0F96|nr:hypothetical protein [Nocardioides sp. InS609-2]
MRMPRLISLVAGLVCLTPLAVTAPAQATENLTTVSEIIVNTRAVSYGHGQLNIVGRVTANNVVLGTYGGAALQERTPANPVWTTISNEPVPGLFASYGVPVLGNTEYRVVYYGYTATSATENNYAPSQSAPVTIRVSRAIKAKTFGHRVVGTVSPDYKNRKVKVLRKVGKKYVPLTKVKTGQDSRFRANLPAGKPGERLRYRLYIPGNADFAATVENYTLRY